MTFKIEGRLPSLNDHITAERRNRFMGAKMKKDTQEAVLWQIKKLVPWEEPSFYWFEWHVSNRRRDPDNVAAFGRKVIMDALQVADKIPNDSMKYILGYADTFKLDKTDYVMVRVYPYVILPAV